MRITKKYKERRDELIENGKKMFLTKGYENTTVDDIVKETGVAKGTFYYYFKSKEDFLEHLVKREGDNIIKNMQKVVEDKKINSLKKLNKIFEVSKKMKIENINIMKAYTEIYYREENFILRYKITKETIERLTPMIAKIIKQGNKEKIFSVSHPYETAELILSLFYIMNDKFAEFILSEEKDAINRLEKLLRTFEEILKKILSIKRGNINFVDVKFIKMFKKQ